MKAGRQSSMPLCRQNLYSISQVSFACDSLVPKSRSLECEVALSNMACLGTYPISGKRKASNSNWGKGKISSIYNWEGSGVFDGNSIASS
jgi:hypothetical protein